MSNSTSSLNGQIVSEIDHYASDLSQQPSHALYGPGKFWESLCAKHIRLLSQYGFEKFKRTINFEYNQWGVHSLRDPKINHLLKQLFCRGQLPWGLLFASANMASATDIRWPDSIDSRTGDTLDEFKMRRFRSMLRLIVYTIYLGLLWQFAKLTDRLGCLNSCDEPLLGAPLPITYHKKLISQDLALSSIELNFIAQHIDMLRVSRVAEIGAGYGRLAYLLRHVFPKVQYTIFDIPPALVLAKHYLDSVQYSGGTSDKGGPVEASLPHRLAEVPDGYFDLIINVSSFDEMSPAQVENYFSLIDQKCKGFLYVKGYRQSLSAGSRLGVQEFPYKNHWVLLSDRIDPVMPSFTERIYKVH